MVVGPHDGLSGASMWSDVNGGRLAELCRLPCPTQFCAGLHHSLAFEEGHLHVGERVQILEGVTVDDDHVC